ncbi:MAG: hypothetical protein KAQ64_01830 [Candidatus Pacebacteria bacterium]|nr:hypothetical protein [Candidatus Paceibacterota bacterium]
MENIIEEDSSLFEKNLPYDKFSEHHMVPLAVKKEINRLISEGFNRKKGKKNAFLAIELNELLNRIEVDKVKRVQIKLHENYNMIFEGDFLPTEVLGKLEKILNDYYKVCGKKNGKTSIARFFFYASKFNNIKYRDKEIEAIDKKLEKNCIFPVEILVLFRMKKEDLKYYLEENFLYPGYYRFYEVWDALSKNGHKEGRRGATKFHKKFINNIKKR